jgi:hypothetical protein
MIVSLCEIVRSNLELEKTKENQRGGNTPRYQLNRTRFQLVGGGHTRSTCPFLLRVAPRQRIAFNCGSMLHAVSFKIAINLDLQAHARGYQVLKQCRQLWDLGCSWPECLYLCKWSLINADGMRQIKMYLLFLFCEDHLVLVMCCTHK